MEFVLFAIPLTINVLTIWKLRGGCRYAALIPFPFLAFAFFLDIKSVVEHHKLAGVFSMIAGPPALLFLLLLAGIQWARRKPK